MKIRWVSQVGEVAPLIDWVAENLLDFALAFTYDTRA